MSFISLYPHRFCKINETQARYFKTQEIFDIPANWKLRAQLVFGSIEAPAGEKTFMAEADRFKTFN